MEKTGQQESDTKQRCQAMIDAGIENPESREGVLFCAGDMHGTVESLCPYEYCVVFEYLDAAGHLCISKSARIGKVSFAKALNSKGVSIKDIALIMGVTTNTIQGYFNK